MNETPLTDSVFISKTPRVITQLLGPCEMRDHCRNIELRMRRAEELLFHAGDRLCSAEVADDLVELIEDNSCEGLIEDAKARGVCSKMVDK